MRAVLVCVSVALAASGALLTGQTAARTSVDWNSVRAEILQRYRDLVQLDTTAGHETRAVDYLRSVLEKDGIPTKTFALDPARANLVARLKGNGSKRPLLILAHTDVVGVQREKWPVDPFGAVIKDGYVWGRGTKDDKPHLTANLVAMLMLARLKVPLDRDVIFLAESGEEADTTGVGINFMVRDHFPEIDAEFAMTEGGGIVVDDGRVSRVNIGTAEKLPARVRLVASGTAGHGSAPRLDNAVVHLAAAVDKVGRWQTPMRLTETTRNYFTQLAAIGPSDKAALYKALLDPATADQAQRTLRERSPGEYSMLRTSVVPTMLKAGVGANVIPSEAEATLDIRILPGENIEQFYTELAKVIDDPAVNIVPIPRSRPPSPASRLDTEMYRAMQAVAGRMFPGAPVLPSMSTGASDQAQLRANSIQSYGIGPGSTDEDTTNYPAHGDVERLAESSLYPFVQYVWEVVTDVAARK
jgi:acetylornithine deacetylase/succinyl-diaminopimelate desuccinylase-like protein